MSQTDVAMRAGLHVRTIYNIESGQKPRSRLTTLFRLAEAVGVNPYWLMSGEGDVETGENSTPVPESWLA